MIEISCIYIYIYIYTTRDSGNESHELREKKIYNAKVFRPQRVLQGVRRDAVYRVDKTRRLGRHPRSGGSRVEKHGEERF